MIETKERRDNWMNTISERMEAYDQIYKEIGTPSDVHEYNRATCNFRGYKNYYIKKEEVADWSRMCMAYADVKKLIKEIEKRLDRN